MTSRQLILKRALIILGVLSLVSANVNAEAGAPGAVYAPKPQYPLAARERGLRGSGIFVCNLRPDGTVASVAVVKTTGYDILDQAAISAFQKWRFKPGGSKSVEIPVKFQMVGARGVRSRMAGAALDRPY